MASASARWRTAATCTTNPGPDGAALTGSFGAATAVATAAAFFDGAGFASAFGAGGGGGTLATAVVANGSWAGSPDGTSSATGSGSSRRLGYVRSNLLEGEAEGLDAADGVAAVSVAEAALRTSSVVVGSEPSAARTGIPR